MQNINDYIRTICARLLETPSDSPEFSEYEARLKKALVTLEAQDQDWKKPPEYDTHQDEARQSYRSRESDSADGFAEGLKLFDRKNRDSEKNKG